MFDLFTYFVYLSLLFFVVFITKKASKSLETTSDEINFIDDTKLTTYHYLALLTISLIVGFRNGVGVDWQGYKDVFYDIVRDIPTYKTELGYYYINKVVAVLGGSSGIMFFIVALISWFFIFKSVSNFLLPLLLFFLFVEEYFFWSMNGVRQFVAISIFLYSIRFIIKRNLKIYLFLIVFAAFFHTTAVLLIPLYFIPYQKLYNQKVWFIAFILSSFLANTPLFVNGMQQIFTQIALQIVLLSNYLKYFDSGQYAAEKLVIGFGFVFKIIINLFIIIFSKEIVKRHPQSKIYFVLFFISTIIFNLFYMYQPIGRINVYFLIMRCVVLSILIYHLWVDREYKFLAATVILLYFILFLTTIYNSSNLCSPYNFSF